MATYTSGNVTIPGLSGVDVDFDDLVNKLYKIESTQANQLVKWHSDWEVRREAFSQVRESLVSMQTALTAINSVSSFLAKSGSSSSESILGASISSDASPGSYSVEINQLATSSVWSTTTGLASKETLVNDSGQDGEFTYTYKGETRTVTVPTGTTLEQLKNLVNNDGENLGVRVQLIQSGDGIVFQLSGLDTGANASLSIDATTNLNGLEIEQEPLWSYSSSSEYNDLICWNTYTSYTDPINTTETPKTFTFDINGESYTVKLAAGGSLADLVNAINEKTADSGVTANVYGYTDNGNTVYGLRLTSQETTDLITVGGGTLEGYSGMLDTTNWQTQAGQNAEIRVNNWPASGWLEVSSNSVSDVADGVTFNLRAEGKATVTVELDSEAIEKNVQTFVDAVNQFRTLIQKLTKISENSAIDPDYAENQAEMQMGSALTGNYGIQLISSNLKQAVTNGAKGFSYAKEIEGKMYGDLFNSLSQIGIITDTDESSATFGLLIINSETTKDGVNYVNSTGTMTLKDALAKDPEAVAKLFAANGEARSNSSAFGVSSTVQGITKPGEYKVSYTTDSSGAIISATINGKTANIDMDKRQISLYSHEGSDDAAGIVLDIYNLTPGTTQEGTVSVRQGKINELLGMLSGTEGILGSKGSLANLENNYDEIMANIKSKIQKEDERLEKWLRLTKLRYSRLQTTLSSYKNLEKSIESQIESLKGSS